MRINIGSDHGGFELKEHIKNRLLGLGHEVVDYGTSNSDSVDYPKYGFAVANATKENQGSYGIVVCGSGIGISIAANRVKGIRAALVRTPEEASLTRQHNDANVLALGGRFTTKEESDEIVDAFFGTTFEGGRHLKRVIGIDEI